MKYYLHPSRLHSHPDQTQRIVSDLDSKLNEFIDSIPDHRTFRMTIHKFYLRTKANPCSQVGTPPRARHIHGPVGVTIYLLLLLANHHPSIVHATATTPVICLVPLTCNMHQRSKILYTHRRYAVDAHGEAPVPPGSLALGS